MSDSQIMAALANLSTRLDEIDARSEQRTNKLRVAIMDRIERLENRLTDQRDDGCHGVR
ncbi:MAG TPA: hypothetical protein VFW75_06920 [Acetobacteraceae bacterium]|nr:hypothetical protein [Acetobacteraceae bacterium]